MEHGDSAQLGRADWLNPSGEEDKMKSRDLSFRFFLREDFQFAERMLQNEILNWMI